MSWPHTFGTQYPSVKLSWLDDQFNQLSSSSTSTVSLAGAALVGFIQSGAGAEAEDLQSRGRLTIYVWDYLTPTDRTALATSSNTTDIAYAINAALTALPATGGTVVLCPGMIGSTVTLNKPINLIGTTHEDGTLTSLYKPAALNGAAINISGSTGVLLQNFALHGVAGNGGDGIVLGAAYAIVRDVTVNGMGGNNIRVGVDGVGTNCNVWTLENVRSYAATGHGLYIHSGDVNANAGLISRCAFETNGGDGVRVGSAALNTFVGCLSEGNTGYGLNFASASAHDNMWVGGDIEANTAGQIIKATGATRNNVFLPNQSQALGAEVKSGVDFSVANTTSTAIVFNTTVWDTDSCVDLVAHPTRITINNPGMYVVTGNVQFTSNATGIRQIGIYVSGSTYAAISNGNALTGLATNLSVSAVIECVAGDYIELMAYQTSGGALNVQAFNGMPVLSVVRQN